MKRTIYPSPLSGRVTIPGSKSHTIRGLLIAALAEGVSRLDAPLESSDTASCISALRALGIVVRKFEDYWEIEGTGGRFTAPKGPIDVGNSGTTLYLATGTAATADIPVTFTGDEQIRRRRAEPLLRSLSDLSARVEYHESEGYVPYTVTGPLRPGETEIESTTSQYLSSLLLAAPLTEPLAGPNRGKSAHNPSNDLNGTENLTGEEIRIRVPLLYEKPYVDMTLDWLDRQGIQYRKEGYEEFFIPAGQRYRPFHTRIPGDFSSATFFAVAAAITGSHLALLGLDFDDSQGDKEVFTILSRMGAEVRQDDTQPDLILVGGESHLEGGTFDLNSIPDALPALAVAACFARSPVHLVNVPQAREKETDRIRVMREELTSLGAVAEESEDGLHIYGEAFSRLQGGKVRGHGDHRIIMALAVAALAAEGPVEIDESDAAAVTFPEFFDFLTKIGARIQTGT